MRGHWDYHVNMLNTLPESETEMYPHVFPHSSRPACTVLRAGQVTFTADVIQPPNIAYTREQFESIAS